MKPYAQMFRRKCSNFHVYDSDQCNGNKKQLWAYRPAAQPRPFTFRCSRLKTLHAHPFENCEYRSRRDIQLCCDLTARQSPSIERRNCACVSMQRARATKVPRSRAAAKPALMRSRITLRSNSATGARTCICRRPAGLLSLASIPCDVARSAVPCASNSE